MAAIPLSPCSPAPEAALPFSPPRVGGERASVRRSRVPPLPHPPPLAMWPFPSAANEAECGCPPPRAGGRRSPPPETQTHFPVHRSRGTFPLVRRALAPAPPPSADRFPTIRPVA